MACECPQCGSQKTEIFNYYYYSDEHHSKKHYKCHICGFQWIIEENPLD